MSRREYPVAERYEETESEFYRRPRRDRNYDDLEVDISNSRSRAGDGRRAETVVRERDTVVSDRRGDRRLDFLRDDYGRSSNAGQLVVREDIRDDDIYRRAPSRRRPAGEVVEKEKIVIDERDVSRGPRGARSEVEFKDVEKDEVIYRRDRTRSRPPPVRAPPPREEVSKEEIDISIRRDDRSRSRPPPPRSEVRERDEVEEIRFRRGGGERPPPPRSAVAEKEEIDIKIDERRRGRRGSTEIVREEIDIRERSVPPPRAALVGKKEEEWIIRRRRSSPPPPPPPEDFEKEEIIIRRREKVAEPPPPSPPREPSPEPPPPPPVLEPIYRPPIIQEVITHYRNFDHGVERARSPTPSPPPPPALPSPPAVEEDDLEIEIKRKGIRNGRAYEEDFLFERDAREVSRPRSASRGPPPRRWEDDDVSETDVYSRKVVHRDGRTKVYASDRMYEDEWSRRRGYASPPPREIAPPPPAPAPPAPVPPPAAKESKEEIKISLETRHGGGETRRGKRDKMWTEVTKDLVIKEAVEESGYEYEETDEFFYVMEYLRYEDVLRLVELTEDIRRERRDRIRELQWSSVREEPPKLLPAPPPPPGARKYDERFYEREYVYDRDSRRYR